MGQGNSKTIEEQMREHKRAMNRAIRDLDRERSQLESQEKKLASDIKAAAAKNQLSTVKVMAKDLVRTKKYIQKFSEMRSQLQAVNLRMQTMKSTQAMSQSLKGVTGVMLKMNKTMNLPAMQKIMSEFMKENEKLGLTEDMMADAVDDAFADDADEEQEEKIVQQTLEEIGVDLNQLLTTAPTGGLAAARQTAAAAPSHAVTAPMAEGAMGAGGSQAPPSVPPAGPPGGAAGPSASNMTELEKSLEERLNNLKK